MIRLLADENFNNNILRALRRRNPELDIERVQDVGLSGADDPSILEWAAGDGRVLLTHDVTTVTRYAYERAERGQSMPGVFAAARSASIASVLDDLLLLAECSLEGEWEAQVRYLPL